MSGWEDFYASREYIGTQPTRANFNPFYRVFSAQVIINVGKGQGREGTWDILERNLISDGNGNIFS